MSTAATITRCDGQPVPLVDLAHQINVEHAAAEAALNTGLEHALEAGRLLLEAKHQMEHGEWLPWVEQHFEGTRRTATTYMRLVKRWPEIENGKRASHLSVRSAVKLLAAPREKTPAGGLPVGFTLESGSALIGECQSHFIRVAESIEHPGYWNVHITDWRPKNAIECGAIIGFKRPVRADCFAETFTWVLSNEHLFVDQFRWQIITNPKTVGTLSRDGDSENHVLWRHDNYWWLERPR